MAIYIIAISTTGIDSMYKRHHPSAPKVVEYLHRIEQAFVIYQYAHKYGIEQSDLELQALLHIPRLMDRPYTVEYDQFIAEIDRLALGIKARQAPYVEWSAVPRTMLSHPSDMHFVSIPESEAQIIHERFHYLSSFRWHSLHFGLRTPSDNKLAVLMSLSPFDLEHLSEGLPTLFHVHNAMVVSRVYSFNWAPRNSTSYLFGRVYDYLQSHYPNIEALFTYINPNMGFDGASFRAANWRLLGFEEGTRYTYLDGAYITERQMVRRFGTAHLQTLQPMFDHRIETTCIDLEPLWVFVYFLHKDLSLHYQDAPLYTFQRP